MGFLFNLQPFSVHDGPGVRTAVFLKGCGLSCRWCHNPESQSPRRQILFRKSRCAGCGACLSACPRAEGGALPRNTNACLLCGKCAEACYSGALEMCGYEIGPEELAETLLRDKAIYDRSGGGVTFTGGEPLLQAGFVRETALILKARGVHLAIETCLHTPASALEAALPLMDLVYADVKCADPGLHAKGTGADNALILANLQKVLFLCPRVILRTPVIPGFNDDEAELSRVAALEAELGAKEAELMTFHNACAGKYESLSRPFDYASAAPPSPEAMERFADLFRARDLSAAVRR